MDDRLLAGVLLLFFGFLAGLLRFGMVSHSLVRDVFWLVVLVLGVYFVYSYLKDVK